MLVFAIKTRKHSLYVQPAGLFMPQIAPPVLSAAAQVSLGPFQAPADPPSEGDHLRAILLKHDLIINYSTSSALQFP